MLPTPGTLWLMSHAADTGLMTFRDGAPIIAAGAALMVGDGRLADIYRGDVLAARIALANTPRLRAAARMHPPTKLSKTRSGCGAAMSR